MPFTPSHAVIALPFVRTPLVPAAIAIGSMTPDLPLFFKFGPDYWFTHDWVGALVVDLPLACVLLLVWRLLLRPATPQLTPRWFAERWPVEWSRRASGSLSLWGGPDATPPARARAAVLLLASLALGIASHLVWDAFTHPYRWGSALIPQLAETVGPFRLWDWAHYTSSVLGLLVIAVWGVVWLRRQTPRPVAQFGPRWLRAVTWWALPGCLVLAGLGIALIFGPPDAPGLRLFVERSGTTGAAAFLVWLAVASGISALKRRDTPGNR